MVGLIRSESCTSANMLSRRDKGMSRDTLIRRVWAAAKSGTPCFLADISGAYDSVHPEVLFAALSRWFDEETATSLSRWNVFRRFYIKADGLSGTYFEKDVLQGLAQGDPASCCT
jgi:hypothetical protein